MTTKNDNDLDYIVGVRLSAEQEAYVRKVAKASKQPMSRYIRGLVEIERQLQMTPCTYESFESSALWGRCKEWITCVIQDIRDMFVGSTHK